MNRKTKKPVKLISPCTSSTITSRNPLLLHFENFLLILGHWFHIDWSYCNNFCFEICVKVVWWCSGYAEYSNTFGKRTTILYREMHAVFFMVSLFWKLSFWDSWHKDTHILFVLNFWLSEFVRRIDNKKMVHESHIQLAKCVVQYLIS